MKEAIKISKHPIRKKKQITRVYIVSPPFNRKLNRERLTLMRAG
jgi:hypothetical protein